jgi:serine/threonine protein kinase
MSDPCKSIINDYIAGALNVTDLDKGLASLFAAIPSCHVSAQNHLQKLLVTDKIDSTHFAEISQLISKVNTLTTLKSGNETNIASFNEDQTLHLLDVTEPSMDYSRDKRIVVPSNIHSSQNISETSTPSIQLQEDRLYSQPDFSARSEKPKEQAALGPGVILKDRFVLLEKLGQGGMGVVYKAKDMLKVEAQDKDPYVAIKVLTNAFKKYSGSFIALQGEASKAQRLAHPNIATVYDFDRDSNTVFMTMEYLQGKPLNQLIKEIAKKPLKTNQALHIINELCSGLAYAHEKRLIHSDFKPGNCFLLSDGRVKLLDFGIAQVSTQNDKERENTVFDPAKLSAVSPSYATPEMFAGMNPDPRDDIYGLACVSYQLLAAGKHPYNKIASPKIKELGIKPKSIKGLNRKQQRTLMKALTVTREDRIATVEKFAEGMRSKKSNAKSMILGAIFISIIIAGIGYKPFIEFQSEQALHDKIQLIKQGDKALMIETIWSLGQLNTEKRKIILVGLRREIITFYHDRVRFVFRPKEGLYDYPQAINLLLQAKKLYPDSVALSTIKDQIKKQKDHLMSSLISSYNRYLNSKQLVKSANGEDMTTVLSMIKRIDPKHYLLKEAKLAGLYLSEAEILITNRQYNDARNYITTGLKLFPDDTRLQNLNKQINAQFIN